MRSLLLAGVSSLLPFAMVSLAGCSAASADPAPESDPPPAVTANDASAPVTVFPTLHVLPNDTYSGFDGAHAFRVPVAVYGGGSDVKLVASDPAMVDIARAALVDPTGDDGVYFMVTTKKSGAVTLTAEAGSSKASATLTIAAYTTDEYAVGAQRYTNAAASGPACISCHSPDGGIDHSPARLASAKDTDVVTVITTGILAEGSPITQVKHKWAVSDAEAAGLVAYLRALAPRGFVASK
nr:hypothetical protein [uncultured bacterium]